MKQTSLSYPRLLGDIGGTNARFAWQDSPDAALADIATYPCSEHESLLHAMQHYLRDRAKPAPRWCAIGIANPIVGDHVKMTNHDWSFSISAVQQSLGAERFLVINDFTALALSLPALTRSDLMQVGGGEPVVGAPLALLGPGTGLGVSGLLAGRGGVGWVPLNGEGGHVTLASANDFEDAVVRRLRQRFGHASAERALSGPGLVNLYVTLAEIAGRGRPTVTAEDVTKLAKQSEPLARKTLGMFCAMLGTVAGDIALTFGARGGVYIAGGIVPRLVDALERSEFRARFEAKGRYRDYLAPIPTYVITATMPAFRGLKHLLDYR